MPGATPAIPALLAFGVGQRRTLHHQPLPAGHATRSKRGGSVFLLRQLVEIVLLSLNKRRLFLHPAGDVPHVGEEPVEPFIESVPAEVLLDEVRPLWREEGEFSTFSSGNSRACTAALTGFRESAGVSSTAGKQARASCVMHSARPGSACCRHVSRCWRKDSFPSAPRILINVSIPGYVPMAAAAWVATLSKSPRASSTSSTRSRIRSICCKTSGRRSNKAA